MEICGGQTHTLIKHGHGGPPPVLSHELVHGPGCPVCVTPLEVVDKAIRHRRATGRDLHLLRRHAARAGHGETDLLRVKAAGRRRAHRLFAHGRRQARARENPERQVVFFAVGFETTAPANAMAVYQAETAKGLKNFSILVSHVLVPPAMDAILESPGNRCRDSSPPATSAP
jgi:hydrogenase expression/formation protein HypD